MENETTLGDYLIRLGEDRDELARFLKNPERAMHDAGVPPEHRDAIISGNVEEIQEILRQELGVDSRVAFIVHWNWPIVHV